MGWFELSIAALVLYGVQGFVLRTAAHRRCNAAAVMLFFLLAAGGLALVAYRFSGSPAVLTPLLLAYAVANAALYVIRQISKIEAMKLVPGVVALPVAASQGLFTALLGIALLQEHVSALQLFGVVISFASIVLIASDNDGSVDRKHFAAGVMIALLAAVVGSGANIVTKIAAVSSNEFLFISFSYFSALLPLYIGQKRLDGSAGGHPKEAVKLGVIAGCVNFAAFTLFLWALREGPIAVIGPLTDMSLLLTSCLVVWAYKEKVTWKRIGALMLALLSVVLLRG